MSTALCLLSWTALGLSSAPLSAAAAGDAKGAALVVIVSANSKLHDMSKSLIKRVFLGEASELEGVHLIPFNYAPDDPLRRAFDFILLGFDSGAAGRYWVDRRIRGQGLPPRIAPTVAVLRAVVAKLPGSIGYLRADQLDPSVRALSVDGLQHGAPGYALTTK